MRSKISNKRGGLIAEAAIIFPVVILAMMAIICILIRMYTDASESVHEHLELRRIAGIRTGTVVWGEDFYRLAPEDKFGKGAFKEAPDILDAGVFPNEYIFTDTGRCYMTDETLYIRRSDFLKSVGEGHEENYE